MESAARILQEKVCALALLEYIKDSEVEENLLPGEGIAGAMGQ